jgi:hypothetical protein
MTEPNQPYDPPQDTGAPDSVETDPAALNAAEDLDEDRLRVDPLEQGMDPPEHWSGVTKYGMTAWEQAHPRPLGERLAEERPDPADEVGTEVPPATGMSEEDATAQEYADDTGIAADIAGGSMAAEYREPAAPRLSEEDSAGLELAGDPDSGDLDSPTWARDDPDAGSASQPPTQLAPVEGDGPPVDTERDEVAVDAGPAPAAGPEQAAVHVESRSS